MSLMPDMRHVGFTGTTKQISPDREERLKTLLRSLDRKGYTVLHHGDAVGCDTIAHTVARRLGFDIQIHPGFSPKRPNDDSMRAYNKPKRGKGFIHKPKPFLARNEDIVGMSECLIAMPRVIGTEERRSGTWMTVRYASKRGRKILFV